MAPHLHPLFAPPERFRRIHLMGACGTGMASLALLLKERGYIVTGSDENVYPPMSELLPKAGIPLFLGYSPANLTPRELGGTAPDLVVVGNVIRRTNPEFEALVRQRLPFLSMPQALSRFGVGKRWPLVVTGTHGKTTTTSLLAWLLHDAGRAPGFFVGGIPDNFGVNASAGGPWDGTSHPAPGDCFVIEGDEYDTACFDKRPKFLHYAPKGAILTAVEFDHADIYANLDAVRAAFRLFCRALKPTSALAYCVDHPEARSAATASSAQPLPYGFGENAVFRAVDIEEGFKGVHFTLLEPDASPRRVFSPQPGRHNVENALAAWALARFVGVSGDALAAGLARFAGVKRRQQVRGVAGGVTIIDDFAHHPTAIRVTLDAIRGRYPGSRVVAVFDPRSNTTRRKVFQRELAQSLAAADLVAIGEPEGMEKIPVDQRLDMDQLMTDTAAFGPTGRPCLRVRDANDAVTQLRPRLRSGDVVLVMSNGGFGGIHDKLLNALNAPNADSASPMAAPT